jgi:methionyl aminopeptidase
VKKGNVRLKTPDEIKRIREAGIIIADIFRALSGEDLAGKTTWEIDSFIDDFIIKRKARAAFKTLRDYNYASCISINDEIIHGVPSKKRKVADADIMKIDIGIVLNGYFADSCTTLSAGTITGEAERLIQCAREALFRGIEQAVPEKSTGDIGHAVEDYASSRGFSVVREFSGHGTGFSLHEPPSIPSFGSKETGYRLREGLVIAIEPALNQGSGSVKKSGNGWTLLTADGKLSAQFEHTVAVTENGPLILTI